MRDGTNVIRQPISTSALIVMRLISNPHDSLDGMMAIYQLFLPNDRSNDQKKLSLLSGTGFFREIHLDISGLMLSFPACSFRERNRTHRFQSRQLRVRESAPFKMGFNHSLFCKFFQGLFRKHLCNAHPCRAATQLQSEFLCLVLEHFRVNIFNKFTKFLLFHR